MISPPASVSKKPAGHGTVAGRIEIARTRVEELDEVPGVDLRDDDRRRSLSSIIETRERGIALRVDVHCNKKDEERHQGKRSHLLHLG